MIHSNDKQWWVKHSGDYVLGLMSNADRLVFERIMQVEPDVQQMVVHWREKLQPLSDALIPIDPPEHILPSLLTNLPPVPDKSAAVSAGTKTAGLAAVGAAVGSAKETKAEKREADKRAGVLADGTAFVRMVDSKQKSLDGWRSYAGLASVAAIAMGVFGWMGLKGNEAEDLEYKFDAISVVEDASAKALWIVDSSSAKNVLRVTSVGVSEVDSGKVYELWMEKPDDGGVVSMGLLPTDINASTQIKARQFDATATGFSVSLEDAGGSPESVPVGPVMFKGLINSLSQ